MNDTETREEDRAVLLVALEPRSYREAIGGAITTLRPDLVVEIVDPDDLVKETLRFRPELVLCSRKKHLTALAATNWIEYYYTDEEPSTVLVNGEREEMPALDLEGMLALIDRMLSAAHPAPDPDQDSPSSVVSMIESITAPPSPNPSTA